LLDKKRGPDRSDQSPVETSAPKIENFCKKLRRGATQVQLDHLRFKRPSEKDAQSYNLFQRLAYLTVVFVLYPFMFVTGFAMSPSITSVFPIFVNIFGGFQTARTLHFFAANLLVLFLFGHVAMVILAGFVKRCRAMITGFPTPRRKIT
jgi:thiosulfate reductase cytochrome b subunit